MKAATRISLPVGSQKPLPSSTPPTLSAFEYRHQRHSVYKQQWPIWPERWQYHAGNIQPHQCHHRLRAPFSSLTLSSYNDISINSAITLAEPVSPAARSLRADNAGNNGGYINVDGNITSNGGAITMGGGSGSITAGSLNSDGTLNPLPLPASPPAIRGSRTVC